MNRPNGRGKYGRLCLYLSLALILPTVWFSWTTFAPGLFDRVGGLFAMAASQSTAPGFELEDLNGSKVSLDQFLGKQPVLLYFWATWCPGCTAVKPQIAELRNKVSEKELAILGINVGTGDSLERVKRFQKGHPSPYPVLYDRNGEVSRKFNVQGIPLFVLVSKEGKVTYRDFEPPKDYKQYLE